MTTTALPPRAACSDLAVRLARGALFTDLARRAAGEGISFRALARLRVSDLTRPERRRLRAGRETQGVRREGELVTASGVPVARVSSLYLPSRIPDLAIHCALWETDVPLGVALRPLGVTRESILVDDDPGDGLAVRSEGRLLIAGVPVALAQEEIPASFALRAWAAAL